MEVSVRKSWMVGVLGVFVAASGCSSSSSSGGDTATTGATGTGGGLGIGGSLGIGGGLGVGGAAGMPGAGGASTKTYATSDCGACVATSCGSAIKSCQADPGCAAYLTCVDACPTDSTGNADKACEAACPAVTGTADKAARAGLTACRTYGAGSKCAACQIMNASTSPLLHQTCGAPPPEDAGNTCYLCIDNHCCNSYQDCHDDAACTTVKTCVQACGKMFPNDTGGYEKCSNDCYAATPAGVAHWAAYNTCTFILCAPDCNNGNPIDPCITCINQSCADPQAACKGNADCFLAFECMSACNCTGNMCSLTDACYLGCEMKYPSVAGTLDAFMSCATAACEVSCGGMQ